ncbi:MAG: hypothetical protein VZR11_02120 [Succinimonas sp.]|nr:hypothetical protein [Succinimonas sp.]
MSDAEDLKNSKNFEQSAKTGASAKPGRLAETVKALAGIIFCLYFFAVMHLDIAAQAPGLGSPGNLLTLAFGSLITGLGLIYPLARRQKEIYFSRLLLPLVFGALAFLAASLMHFWQKGLVNFEPAIWGSLITLFVFALGQFRLSPAGIRAILSIIAVSGIIEAVIGIWQGMHGTVPRGCFPSPWTLGIFLNTAMAAALWVLITSERVTFLRLLITVITLGASLAAMTYIHDITLFNIAVLTAMLGFLAFSKSENSLISRDKALIYITMTLTFTGIIASIFLSKFEHIGVAVENDFVHRMIKDAPFAGHGFGTFVRTHAEWLFQNIPTLPYAPPAEGNLLRILAIEGGAPAIIGIVFFAYAIVRSALCKERRLYASLGILTLSLPVISAVIINSCLEEAYILPLCLGIFAVLADPPYSGKTAKFRSVEAFALGGAALPVATLAFVITGLMSLPALNSMIAANTFQLTAENRILNPIPRLGEFVRGRDTEATANALNTGIAGLILESRMNLENSLPYTVSCSSLKAARDADEELAREKSFLKKAAPDFRLPEPDLSNAFITYICGDTDKYLSPEQRARNSYFYYRTRLINSEKENGIAGIPAIVTSPVPYILFKAAEHYAGEKKEKKEKENKEKAAEK